MFNERKHNYPKSSGEEPVCPFSDIVEIGNKLSGLSVTPKEFCTESIHNAQYKRGGCFGYSELISANFYPEASCAKSAKLLEGQLKIVAKKVKLPTDEDVVAKIDSAKSLDNKSEIIQAHEKLKQKHALREGIITRWRQVIFETCCSTTKDNENGHFRRFNSADELTEKEIIDKVNIFSQALNKIVEYEDEMLTRCFDEAKNCPKSPRYHNYGSFD